MTTLESRVKQRLRELERERRVPGEPTEAEVEYLLDAAPFIREYGSATSVDQSAKRGGAGIDRFVTVTSKSNKSLVFQQYLAQVEKNKEAAQALTPRFRPVRATEEEMTCAACKEPLVYNARESDLLCTSCGVAKTHDHGQHITYEQEVQYSVTTYFAYKRLNHFTEWLNSLQAKENTEIPVDVLEAVRAEFKKERACKRSDITPDKVRAFLKKLKLNKWYEHKHNICNALNGVPAPKLPQYLEDRLKQMFGEIQKPFERHCPATRKNFLSYSYVLYKFCELLGEDQVARYFPLLKSSEKLYQQDQIWKKICNELQWEFIASL